MSAAGAVFASPKPVIGMIHVGALPGTPAGRASMRELEAQAVAEARVYRDGGVHGIAIENMHDVPYLKGSVGPEITAAMTILARAVKAESGLPCGIQILAGANHEALAVAHAASLDFVRVEGFAFAHVADEGIIESSAASLLRFRRAIGAERVQVWADVKKKHSSHAITADVNVGDTAAAAEFMRADAVIVTGAATGEEPDDVALTAGAVLRLPLYIGSGITADNLSTLRPARRRLHRGLVLQAGRALERVGRPAPRRALHEPARPGYRVASRRARPRTAPLIIRLTRGERESALIRCRDRREPDRGRLRIPAEDHLEQPRELLARRAVRHLVLMALDLARVEHVHVNVHVDLVGRAAQAIELREHGRRGPPEIVDTQLLDAERSSSSCSSGSVSRTPAITTCESASGGSRCASSRMRCSARPVATATGMPPSEPLRVVSGVLKSGCASSHSMPMRSGARVGPGMLQTRDEPGHGGARTEQPDREVALPLVAARRSPRSGPTRSRVASSRRTPCSPRRVRPASATRTCAPCDARYCWMPPVAMRRGPGDVPLGTNGCCASRTRSFPSAAV